MLPIGLRNPCCRAILTVALIVYGWVDTVNAYERWADQRSAGPIVCHADFSLDKYRDLFTDLAGLQAELVRVLAIKPAAEPIELFLFRNKSSYRAFLQRQFPQVPYRRALYVKRDGPGMVFAYRHSELRVDVRHECTHALLHASLPMVPLWLDEGLAEYFEVPPEDRASGHAHLSSLRWNLRLGMVPSLEALEQRGDLADMGAQEYRYSWAWVHFMLHGPTDAHRELVAFLADIQQGIPPDRLSERLSRKMPDAERQLVRHFKYWREQQADRVMARAAVPATPALYRPSDPPVAR